jgi:DTW domain-containing protein YfiP
LPGRKASSKASCASRRALLATTRKLTLTQFSYFKRPARYGKLRRGPRSDGLSTIEAAAMLLSPLEHKLEIETALNATFERLLARYRETRPVAPARRRR